MLPVACHSEDTCQHFYICCKTTCQHFLRCDTGTCQHLHVVVEVPAGTCMLQQGHLLALVYCSRGICQHLYIVAGASASTCMLQQGHLLALVCSSRGTCQRIHLKQAPAAFNQGSASPAREHMSNDLALTNSQQNVKSSAHRY